MSFNVIAQNIKNWHLGSKKHLNLSGIDPKSWIFLFNKYHQNKIGPFFNRRHLIICENTEQAEGIYSSIKLTHPDLALFFPGLDASPYSSHVASEGDLFKRFYALGNLLENPTKKYIIVCSAESFLLKQPPASFFTDNSFHIEVSDIISPMQLASKLVSIGYVSSTSVEEPGTFSKKGEIFDIYPTSRGPIRIHYFDDMIEEIFAINPQNQRTDKKFKFEKVNILPSTSILSNKIFAAVLRENIAMPSPQFKEKYEFRKTIFQKLSDGFLFENYPAFLPLFFNNHSYISNYLENDDLITVLESSAVKGEASAFFEELNKDFIYYNDSTEEFSLLPSIENLYETNFEKILNDKKSINVNALDIIYDFEGSEDYPLKLILEDCKLYLNRFINPVLKKPEFLKEVFNFLNEQFLKNSQLIFVYSKEASLREFKYLLDLYNIPPQLQNNITFCNLELSSGFYYETEKILVLTEVDLFSLKKQKVSQTDSLENTDLFAEQISTLSEGDFVIHKEHGIGKFIQIEPLDFNGSKTDFLVIEYTGKDKVYVPVYKINLVQKHANATAKVRVENLRGNKFILAKTRAKTSAKKLAFDLIKLQAKRESSRGFEFTPPDHDFTEFELAFPFQETPDQSTAIETVIKSMQKIRPMDHLVCGDVGFGKTEVAMRAAYKAVLDKKQVAILVPTTVLALQHFISFTNRFKDFAVSVEFISRFKSAKEIKVIKENLESGSIDIIIGTHKLLSDTIKYKDLGLVVVDEEQRFGVNHKEKLKDMKSSVDFLTLTATPIPRTLQLAFLGLRDLSLIQTAPPRRQSIKSYIIKEDFLTLQKAIEKELSRGGQVFIVHNRVQDIEEFSAKIRDLVPSAKIIIAHGQLPEKELEKRMRDFYAGSYNILISTTIIESGIDIPNANTMIIDRADNFGLAQLHQLRGRIGRSEKKAYAYFMVPKNRNLTEVAERRLKALQTYADVGSGFNIASCDLEIRGAGDILGGEQSGHIECIGLELYMDLLKEAIAEVKGETKISSSSIEILTPFPAFISNEFIENTSERLKHYKKLSNAKSLSSISNQKVTLEDIYGPLPVEFKNLFTILESRVYLKNSGLKSIIVGGSSITLQFDQGELEKHQELRNNIVDTFIGKPKKYQFTPDFKVICHFKEEVSPSSLLEFSKNIAEQIIPC